MPWLKLQRLRQSFLPHQSFKSFYHTFCHILQERVTTCPTQEVFKDPFPKDLASLFLEEDTVAETSSEDTTTVEPINILVEPTEWSTLVENTKALLADIRDIRGQLSSFGVKSQGHGPSSQAYNPSDWSPPPSRTAYENTSHYHVFKKSGPKKKPLKLVYLHARMCRYI